jgi:medium-chain acyl-[acyl-carrier-protein] hydrolase
MPGREDRIGERPLSSPVVAVEWLVRELVPWLDKPFALFGHSLGALLSFELARRLPRDHYRKFTHLFVSGKRAPHLPLDEPPTYSLPDEEFANELRRLAGTPEKVLQEPELMSVLMPLLRADFCLSQTYKFREALPLKVAITAYGGIEDTDVSPEQVEAWSEHTTGGFRKAMFPGGHFFVNEHPAALFAELVPELERIVAAV